MILELTGTSRERGRQHGHRLRTEIGHRLAATPAVPPTALAPWITAIRDTAVYEELLGIAEGAGRTVDEIILLNAFEAIDPTAQPELGGCTLIAGEGGIVAQNWDGNESLAATVGVHVHSGPDIPTTLVLASPGGLGWVGMNEAGLALANSDLLTRATTPGIPSQVLRRLVLRTTSVAEALDVIRSTPPVGGRTYLLGDASGAVRMVELAAESSAVVLPPASRLAHTNHALTGEVARWQDTDLLARIYPSTHSRLDRANDLLDDPAPLTPARAHAILADHTHLPLSICRHTSADEPTTTAASLLFDCGDRTATVALGPPCTTRPVRYPLTRGRPR
jgi:isopenicillin-N N-acyltransferase like protein